MSEFYQDQDAVDAQKRIVWRRKELGVYLDDAVQVRGLLRSEPCYTRDTDKQETQEIQETQDSQEIQRKPTCSIEHATVVSDSLSIEQPLDRYILAAASEAQALLSSREHDDPWMTPLWHFVRLAKGHPELKDLSASDAMERIEPMLMQYAVNESLGDLDDPFGAIGNDYDCGSRLEFLTSWPKVRYAPGWTPLNYAQEQSAKHPYTPPICRGGKMPQYACFVSLAGWLQVGVGNRNILLPCATLAGKFGNKMQVSRLRQLAVSDGFLVEVKAHRFRSKGKGEATEFRFDVSVAPKFLEEAAEGCAEAFRKAKYNTQGGP